MKKINTGKLLTKKAHWLKIIGLKINNFNTGDTDNFNTDDSMIKINNFNTKKLGYFYGHNFPDGQSLWPNFQLLHLC